MDQRFDWKSLDALKILAELRNMTMGSLTPTEIAEKLNRQFKTDFTRSAIWHTQRRYADDLLAQVEDQPLSGVSEEEALKWLESLGYELHKDTAPTDRVHQIDSERWTKTGLIRLGLVSDTHLGSKYAQLTVLHDAYRAFEDEQVDAVLHSGDLIEGEGMYKGQEYEIIAHGADEQIEYAKKNYPRSDKITTHVIGGSHDCSFLGRAGINALRRLCEERSDLMYLGNHGAHLLIGDVVFYLHHPDGGVPYARSYKTQKQIEQFSPENKPQVLVRGHCHINCVLPMYRNVYAIDVGCMQSQTPYLTRKGLYPEIGFGILEVETNAKGTLSFRYQWFPEYLPKKNDY